MKTEIVVSSGISGYNYFKTGFFLLAVLKPSEFERSTCKTRISSEG